MCNIYIYIYIYIYVCILSTQLLCFSNSDIKIFSPTMKISSPTAKFLSETPGI